MKRPKTHFINKKNSFRLSFSHFLSSSSIALARYSLSRTLPMDSRAAFDAWLAETPFTVDADAIYERFSHAIALEDCLLSIDPENPALLSFCVACDPITFSVEGSPHMWVPKTFLYDLKRTTAHKKAVDRAVASFPDHLHTPVDVERDVALSIYLIYTDVEDTTEDETPTLSYIPYLDEEPAENILPLQEEAALSQALVLQPSTSARPFAVEAPLVAPLASLTPLIIDGVEYLFLQDVLEVLDMREEELYSNLISDVDDSFLDLDVQEQPPAINEVGRYDGTSVSTLDAIVAIQESIAQAAPEYDIPDDEFEAFQAQLFGPRSQHEPALQSNEEHAPLSGCDLTTQTLAEQDIAEQV